MPYIISLRLHYAGGAVLLLVTNAFALLIPWFMKLAVEGLQYPEQGGYAPGVCAAVIIVLALAHCAARIFSRTLVLNAARIIEFKIREVLFFKLQQQDLTFFSHHRTGDVLSRFSNDLTNVRMLTGFGILSTANALILYVAAVALMLHINPGLTLYALLPFPLMVVVVQRISRRMFSCSLEVQEELGRLTSLAEESVSAVRLIKSYCREHHFQEVFGGASKRYLELNLVMSRLRGLIMPVMALATGAGTLAVLFIGGRLVISGRISLGDFVAFSGYLAMLVWPTVMMGWILTMVQRGASSMERLNAVLMAEPRVSDVQGAKEIAGESFDIEFRNLSFSYGDVKVLDDMSITVCAGERVGITGDVGSGKSTLLRLIPRLLPVEDGRLFFNGQDVNQLTLSSLRAKIGYVPQEAFLFSRSIQENIAYGAGHDGGDVQAAAGKAGFDEDIARFGDGLDTVVGERGVALSGGQKQRLSIARALISERPVLLLDDPLSAVDAEHEEQILAELDSYFGNRTVLVVSHRMSVFRNCDRIIVLKHGRVAEEGRVEELLAAGGLYAEMCLKQGLGIEE